MSKKTESLVVSIWCLTYNHEPYIRQCLEGFVMQKTNFRFEAIVHDDASTDGTALIIREYAEKYPDIIKPIYEKENQYSKHDGTLDRIMYASCKGKYIAMCEGDDYWIDPLKLHKQVAFLEKHPSYGMCFTRVKYRQADAFLNEPVIDNVDTITLIKRNTIRTLSVLYKRDLYMEFYDFSKKNGIPIYDYPLFLWFSYYSQIGYIEDITGVYRIVGNSLTHSNSDAKRIISFYELCMKVRAFWIEKLRITPDLYIYEHNIKCYKYAIIKNDRVLVKKYRNILNKMDKSKIVNRSFFWDFLSVSKIDVLCSRMIAFLKPFLKRVRFLFNIFS